MQEQNFLTTIIESKKRRLDVARANRPLERVREEALSMRRNSKQHALHAALSDGPRLKIIAEFKRASPSKGNIRKTASPAEIARAYAAGGASAISVLTEEDHFRGSLVDLRTVRANVSLPILRKDFIFDEYQIYEAAAAGADALLLIVAALDDELLSRLHRLTDALGMDALVEVHTTEELRCAEKCGAKIIGVNNRDLRTFKVSLDVSREVSRQAQKDAVLISESGLATSADLLDLASHGYKGFLIGETFMRKENPEDALRGLLSEVEGIETKLHRRGAEETQRIAES